MGRETLVTDKIVDKGGGVLTLGIAGAATVSAGGDLTLIAGPQLRVVGATKILRANFTFSTFSVAAATKFVDFSWNDIVTNAYIPLDCVVRKITDFTGGSVSVVECTVGDSASAVAYIAASKVDLVSGAPAMSALLLSDRGADIATPGTLVVKAAGTAMRITLNTTGDDLDQLAAGEASVYFRYFTIPAD